VNRDKVKDIMRGVLPSCARKWARMEGRYIARVRRRLVREALSNVCPDDEWDDALAFARLGKRESKVRSRECERVRSRRDADKLGPLKRWTKHQQRTSEDDDKAYEKICEVLQPNRNLITRHAVGHAEQWLELKKDEHDRNWYENWSSRQPAPILGVKELTKIIVALFESQHAKLNRCFKDRKLGHLLISKTCTDEDPCTWMEAYTHRYPEALDPATKRWITYDPILERGLFAKTRVRLDRREFPRHDSGKCPNTVLMRHRGDEEEVVNQLIGFRGVWKHELVVSNNGDYHLHGRHYVSKHGLALSRVLNLAMGQDLLTQRVLDAMRENTEVNQDG